MDSTLYYDEHEPCRTELRRLNNEWQERYYNAHRVIQVFQRRRDGVLIALPIKEVYFTDNGYAVIVE